VWAVLLVLFVAVDSYGFPVGFLFPRVMLSRHVVLSPTDGLGGRERFHLWVGGLII
jgi:hypothetical protein